MKIECGGLLFTSDFDSGNLDKVEFVENIEINETKTCESCSDTNLPPVSNFRFVRRPKNRPETPVSSPVHSKKYQLKKRSLHGKIKSNTSKKSFSELNSSIREFKVWTKPDCSGTPYQTTFRTWFYFGIAGGPPGVVVKINVMNLNRQGKLYFHGMKPVFKVVPSKDGWKRIPGKVDFKCASDGNFTISFCHTLPNENESMTYFAFTYPFSYSECQNMLDAIDERLGTSLYISKSNRPADSTIYYSRELLCYTSEGNKVELLTVTSCKGLTMEREKNLPDLFPDNSKPRCHVFQNKKVVFISSRVHPGETPSSFVLNGMLHYLTSSKDGIANRLRNLFVFKIIPMLNPDGVLKGHYRADLQGLNLNRIYMVANFQQHPSIYAARTALLHYHTSYSSSDEGVGSSRSTLRKPQNHQININTRFNQKSKNVPKKFSKDIINQIHQTKALAPKHSLHTCDTISKNLNFLQSVPVILPISNKVCDSIFSNQDSKTSTSKTHHVSPVSVVDEDSLDLTVEDMKRIGRSSEGCSECKLSDYPSKKITLENDVSCNCIEPSDADDSSSVGCEVRLGEGEASTFLKDIPIIKPEDSGIAFYFDLHGHASKRGCFIYGNYLPEIDKMVECMFLPKLMSVNCPYFDFSACNFSAENMYSGSNSNVQSKEGSGRVSLYVLTGIIHSYTLECNYNTCRFTANQKRLKGSTVNVPSQVFFTPEIYQEIGESLLVSILDAYGHNPKSQISNSQFLSVQGVKEWLKQHALSLRGRCAPSHLRRNTVSSLRSQEKLSPRATPVKRTTLFCSTKSLQRESSSSNANLSSNASDSEGRNIRLKKGIISKSNRGTVSLLASPVSNRPSLLERRHTFSQDGSFKSFKRTKVPVNRTTPP